MRNVKSVLIIIFIISCNLSAECQKSGSKDKIKSLIVLRRSSLEAEYIFQRDYKPDISNEHVISINYIFKF
jgi:hypothetical protein